MNKRKTNMETKTIFVLGIALFALILSVAAVSASAEEPAWVREPGWDLPSEGYVGFADLDDDGDFDAMYGRYYYLLGYENTGDASSPTWTANSSWDLPGKLPGGVYNCYGTTALPDLDGDGDYDMLVGTYNGYTLAYENTGSAASPTWTRNTSWEPPVAGGGKYATKTRPAFADLDADGDYDLLITASKSGYPFIHAYENTGDASSPVWTSKTEWEPPVTEKEKAPALADLDNDGDYDLIIGHTYAYTPGSAEAYENTGSASSPVWTRKVEWDVVAKGKPTFVDLDGDGDPDLMLDNHAYKNAEPDLTVTGISHGNVFATESNTISATIENIGGADVGAFNVSLSADGTVVDKANVAGLTGGASEDVSFSWTPGQPGSYTLNVFADCALEVGESDETNNHMSKSVYAIQPGNVLHFVPDNSSAGYCESVEVELIADVNATNPITATSVNFTFNLDCVEITDFAGNTSVWAGGIFGPTVDFCNAHGYFTRSTSVGTNPAVTGTVPLGTLTLHCKDTDGCCVSLLDLTAGEYTDVSMDTLYAALDDGTFTCGNPVEVNKTVWDPEKEEWVDELITPIGVLGNEVTFKSEIHARCCNLTNLVIWDNMTDSLNFSEMLEGPSEPSYVSPDKKSVRWDIAGPLAPSETITIKFNATTVRYGVDYNVQNATGICKETGVEVSDEDEAKVTVPAPGGDLSVTGIQINPGCSNVADEIFVNESNEICAILYNDGPKNITDPFDVCFASDITGKIGCVRMVDGLLVGQNETVCINWTPDCANYPATVYTSVPFTLNVTADCNCTECPDCPKDGTNGELIEPYEDNNTLTRDLNVYTNGYKSKNFGCDEEPLELFKYYEIHETPGWSGIAYSVSGEKITLDPGNAVTWTHSIAMPGSGVTVKDARLYAYWYHWANPSNANLSVSVNGASVPMDKAYFDRKGFGSYDYPKGTYAYNVTNLVSGPGDYTLDITNTGTGATKLTGSMLVVVYEGNDATTPEMQVWMMEGCDYLMAADATHGNYNYCVSPEEATATVTFPGTAINIAEKKGRLITVVAQGNAPGSDLSFNTQVWQDVWETFIGATKIDVDDRDVTSYMVGADNTVDFRDTGTNGMQASNAILVVKKPPKVGIEFSPSNMTEVVPGESFTANVAVDSRGYPIYGVEYELSFDPTVIHAEWQNEGDFLNQDGASTNIYAFNIDNSIGKISFAITRTGTSVGVTGTGTLARIGFTAHEQEGASTDLTFIRVKATDANAQKIEPLDILGGSVHITANILPVPIAQSVHEHNNVGDEYLSNTYFDASASSDPDGTITYYGWVFGDGRYGTGETVDHIYGSWNWNGASYDPFDVTLMVKDDGTPILENSFTFPVNVYIAGDANGDGEVDIIDGTIVGLEFWATCSGDSWGSADRKDMADLNNDCEVDIIDATIVGVTFWDTAW